MPKHVTGLPAWSCAASSTANTREPHAFSFSQDMSMNQNFFFETHEPEFQMASDVKNSTNIFFCPDVSSRYQQTIRNEPNVVGPRMHDQLRMGSDSDPFPIYIRSPEIQKPSRMPVTVQCLLRQWIRCNMAKSCVLLKILPSAKPYC